MLVLLPARLLRRLVVLRSVCPSVILAAQLRTLLRHDFEHSLMITFGPPADSDAASRSAGWLQLLGSVQLTGTATRSPFFYENRVAVKEVSTNSGTDEHELVLGGSSHGYRCATSTCWWSSGAAGPTARTRFLM